jgi:glycosyltransferase involved in cell wall biosynthesis
LRLSPAAGSITIPAIMDVFPRTPTDRRIAQLEAALCRRGEQLDEAYAALAAVQQSHAYRFAQLLSKVAGRLLPAGSRRRRLVRSMARSFARGVRRLTGRNPANIGEGGEGTRVALDSFQYTRWIRSHEPPALPATFSRRPVISVVVPVYNPPADFLAALIDSVAAQTYDRWELCLADGGSTDARVHEVLDRAASADPRVKVDRIGENRGIAGNTNAALAVATGDYVAFADHDDTLAPFALAAVVAAINRHPDADLIYSDEDKLDAAGRRVDPCFKPDWSPDLLRTHNYVCHLLVLKRSLVEELGGVRAGFDGAQDYDLVLRAGERAKQIVHIPYVLYHWRQHARSTARDTSSKEYLVAAGRRALEEHLARVGCDARVTPAAKPGEYRVRYRLPKQPLVSVIVPNRDQPQLLGRCLDSVFASGYANLEVIVAENGSRDDDTFAYYRQQERDRNVRVLTWNRPFNYAAINNWAAAQARGEVLLFLNNDVEAVDPDWIEAMATHAVRAEIGAVGAKLLYADGTIQHAGVVLGMGGAAGHVHLRFPRDADGYLGRLRRVQEVAAVTGACLMTRADVFERAGGFDERFVLAYNDVDYGLTVRSMGYRVLWTPEAELYHFESRTRGYEDDPVKQARFRREFDLFRRKWEQALAAGDPYFSPNFRLDRADAALRA